VRVWNNNHLKTESEHRLTGEDTQCPEGTMGFYPELTLSGILDELELDCLYLSSNLLSQYDLFSIQLGCR